MLDPAALASAAVGLLVPFLERLGGRTLDQVGGHVVDAADGKVMALYQRVKAKVLGDDYEAALLRGVETSPGNPTKQVNLERALAERLDHDDAFAAALQRLVDEALAAGAPTVQAGDTGAIAGHDFIQTAEGGGTNVGRDQVIYGTPPPSPPLR